ncbi:MAG: flagellar hook-length control protein FliK [Campylobacterota bacterium]|nr:flagellar hook-length control protein FliK [Campylobacterota bacterium]
MISLEQKTVTSTSSSPIGTSAKEESETPALSFSELLKGKKGNILAKDEKVTQSDKVVQNGALILSLEENVEPQTALKSSKSDTLLSLLKGEKVIKETELPLAFNPEVTESMKPVEIKQLIQDAKTYLKTKIIESEGFKKSEIEALPKTLKGLAEVAKKFGIDVSKITLEEVKVDTKVAVKLELKVETPLKQTPQRSDSKETDVKVKSTEKEIKVNIAKVDVEPEIEVKVVKQVKTSFKETETREDTQRFTEQTKTDTKAKEVPVALKSTPLFKAQASKEITTEQLVNAKINTTEEVKSPKQKSDETLKMLLRGDKVTQKDTGFTADFSVATARVIAPQATTDARKNLETLLRGDSGENSSAAKTDGLNVNKADSFEVKLNEAKQMTKYLSQDIKTAIEDYKSPFTRVKVQLNPQKLGEVDLTVVQRGKNLHINLSSNNVAINTLALNANDLKAQLSNNGINNASLNFNNNSQNSESSFSGQQQQQNSQNEREAGREYNYFENEEVNEEVLNSLEIVVPSYA